MTERTHLASAALVVVLALCACSDREEPAPTAPVAAGAAPAAPVAPPTTPPGQTVGGDGSDIELSALAAADLKAQPLAGELACSFSTDAASPLLIARGNVASREAAVGAVKVSGYVERVAAPGGFDGMLDGATFTGQGKTIRIAPTGPATGDGESPPRPATLTYERADGASLTLAGRWECGP